MRSRSDRSGWCRGWGSNPQLAKARADFKSAAYANFATPARPHCSPPLILTFCATQVSHACASKYVTTDYTATMQTVAILASDLMFQPRIEAGVASIGARPHVIATAMDVGPSGASLLVVDLHERAADPLEAIAAARDAGVRVLAFGRHTEPETLRGARAAGADLAVARSQLVEELPALLSKLLGAAQRQPS